MMSIETLLQMLLRPPYEAGQTLHPNGENGEKYAFDDSDRSAEELLKGTIMALPDASFLEGVELDDEKAALTEIQKSWVGGYVTGRAWAFQQMGLLIAVHLQKMDDAAIDALADYRWDENAPQQELLSIFCDLALQCQLARNEPGDR